MSEVFSTPLKAGVTLDLYVTDTLHPAPTWTMTASLRGPSAIDLTSVASNNQHRFNESHETTSNWIPGEYWYQVFVTDGTDRFTVDEGQVLIKADLSVIDGAFDGRSHVERVLETIEAVIEGRATKDQERYRIKDRELYRTPMSELLTLRDKYRAELRRQQSAKRRGQSLLGRAIKYQF